MIGFSRNDFPFFTHNPNISYLDNASSTHKPQIVINTVNHYVTHDYSNIHRGDYDIAFRSEEYYCQAKKICADWLGKHEHDIVFGPSGTAIAQRFINAIVSLPNIRRICVGLRDHHATIVPLQIAQKQHGFILDYCPLTAQGDPDYNRITNNPCDVFVCSHASNVTGMVVDTHRLRDCLPVSTIIILDMSQTFAHRSCTDATYDICFATSHKAYAMAGCGIGRIHPALRDRCIPLHGGGGVVDDVTINGFIRKSGVAGREPGTPNLESIVSLGASLKYLRDGGGIQAIRTHENIFDTIMLQMQQDFIHKRGPLLTLLPPGTDHCPVYSFSCTNLKEKTGLGIRALTQRLGDAGVCVRGGGHCAYPLMHSLGLTEGTIRVSCGLYTNYDEIKHFWDCVDAFCMQYIIR